MKSIRQKILSVSYLLLSIFSLVILHSCKDNPITPSEDFAPSRFYWRSIDIQGTGFSGAWATDTNKIFLLNYYNKSLYVVSNGIISNYYVGEYYLNEIKGLSNNEVYLFGTGISDQKLTIIKWNGGGFEYYPSGIKVTGNNSSRVKGCSINSNDIWILSQNGIIKYNGTNLINYPYNDSLLEPIDIFLSNENKNQYISIRYFNESYIQQSLYELHDTAFVCIYNYKGAINPPRTYIFLQQLSGYKIGIEPNDDIKKLCIYDFRDSSFTNYFCFNNKIVTDYWEVQSNNPVGINPQNFIIMVEAKDNIFNSQKEPGILSRVGLLHWDGKIVSKEIGLPSIISPYPYEAYILHNINPNSYLVLCPVSPNVGNSTLYIGTKK
jgi:hypothetical protein